MRYKLPNREKSKLISKPIVLNDHVKYIKESNDTSLQLAVQEFNFATAVASFAQLLKGGETITMGDMNYESILEMAEKNKGNDPYGYRKEFVTLVRTAKSIAQESLTNYA